jgi:hypothetical protein
MNITRIEQETIISYNQEEKTAEVYTYHPALVRKLDKACALFPDAFIFEQEVSGARTYTVPKCYVSVRLPSIRTPEQIQRQVEHMTSMRSKAKNALLQR